MCAPGRSPGSRQVRLRSGQRPRCRCAGTACCCWAGCAVAAFSSVGTVAVASTGEVDASGSSERLFSHVMTSTTRMIPPIAAKTSHFGMVRAGSTGSNTSGLLARTVVRPSRREGRRRFRSGRGRRRSHSSWRNLSCRSGRGAATQSPASRFCKVAERNPRLRGDVFEGNLLLSRARRAVARRPSSSGMMSSFSVIRSNPNFDPLVEGAARACQPRVSRPASQPIATLCRRAQSESVLRMFAGGLSSNCSTRVRIAAGVQRADHRLDRSDGGRRDRELLDAEADQRHRLQRPAAHLAAHAHRHTGFAGLPADAPRKRRMAGLSQS